eukprot:s1553_g13.t1
MARRERVEKCCESWPRNINWTVDLPTTCCAWARSMQRRVTSPGCDKSMRPSRRRIASFWGCTSPRRPNNDESSVAPTWIGLPKLLSHCAGASETSWLADQPVKLSVTRQIKLAERSD